ncbi:MAG: tryptophan--tRNA ligase, partial [Stellaceae bacterium]
CLYCVVDMHAITVFQDPGQLASQTREIASAFLAAGVDGRKQIIFNQSMVPEHAELAWIFNCVARMGWMMRMTQFKDKAGKNSENVSLGLFAYPSLMAADILLYKATHVPVGEDQKQHLELARDIAGAFNRRYGVEFFPLPEPQIFGASTRVMSLRDGTKKMSKSDSSDYSRLNMTDDDNAIMSKIKKAKTDPAPLPTTMEEADKRPEASNLLGIYASLADIPPEKAVEKFAGASFSNFKHELTAKAFEVLVPIGKEMKRLIADPGYIDGVLHRGADRANAIAAPILREVFDIMGLLRP